MTDNADDLTDLFIMSAKLEEALMGKRGGLDRIKMPYITFPAWAEVSITFPFVSAAARFNIRRKSKPGQSISVYCDTKEMLGYFGGPYWEAYPIGEGTARFALDDTDGLIKAIKKELRRKNND